MTGSAIPTRRSVLALAGILVLPRTARASNRPVNTLPARAGVAIGGYDPVAYFREGAPRQGRPEHAFLHAGATWRFASAANLASFAGDTARYMPAYGGFCAYGTSRGYLVKIEPDAWTIINDRLYLNYDLGTRRTWLGDTATYIARADRRWPTLSERDIR